MNMRPPLFSVHTVHPHKGLVIIIANWMDNPDVYPRITTVTTQLADPCKRINMHGVVTAYVTVLSSVAAAPK
eukprot:jgi/Chrzof1/10167/Cz04g31130.t1